MATQTARGPDSLQPYFETESEDSDATSGSEDETTDEEEEEEDEDDEDERAPPPRSTPANVGTKRSDPSIVHKKNKYATSDSGYSSLTATTASSSQSKKATEQPSKLEKIKQGLVQTLKMPSKTVAPAARPAGARRLSHRHERTARELRSVESREEAARMTLSGSSTRAVATRRPSEPVSLPRTMPGGYPPSPTKLSHPTQPTASKPRPASRPRATTSGKITAPRPVSYHAGSAPVVYQLAQPVQQYHIPQQAIQQQAHQHMYQTPPQAITQPMYAQPSPYYSGSYTTPVNYATSSISNSPYTPGYPYPPGNMTPQYVNQPSPQHQHRPHSQQFWPASSGAYNGTQSGGYNGALGEFYETHARRMSTTNPQASGYEYNVSSYYQDTQQHAQYPALRRMSQSVQHHQPMFHPPRTPIDTDEGVFLEDDDPDDFYRGFTGIIERTEMPPPPRPMSSHRQRPPMIHARTTSAAHQAQRLSRGSIEYQLPEPSSRKTSFDGSRPPSRPGMLQRYSTTSAHPTRVARAEPPSPVRVRHRPGSIYANGDVEPRLQAAEAYQYEKTGGYGPSVANDDLPAISRRTTRTSDAGSKDSRTSGSRENSDKHVKRISRHSLDKSRLRESHDPGVTLNIRGVQLDLKGGSSVAIKQAHEGMKQSTAGASGNRPSSTRLSGEPSRTQAERPEVKRYISGSNSNRSAREKDAGDVEVHKKRRSSSVQARIGGDRGGGDLADSLSRLRLESSSRQSRRSSRSGRVLREAS